MSRPTLLGQLSRAHVLVVAVTCALLVVLALGGSAWLLRQHQDRFIEAIAVEVANGVEVEANEEKVSIVAGAEEYFAETRLAEFRFELLDREGRIVAADGRLPGWEGESFTLPVAASVLTPEPRAGVSRHGRFRGCARFCGTENVIRIVTTDVLARPEIQRLGLTLVFALPIAAGFGALVGRRVFRRRLEPLGRLEAAAEATVAHPGASLEVEADAREIATLRDAFNGLLARLGDALSRERRFGHEASHELRTPLAALRARIERLSAETALSGPQRDHLAAALREVGNLDRLIDALLLLARSESAPLPATPVNLCDVAREVAQRQAVADGAASPAPEVEAPDEILVRGSEELLTRAIANLVENARKFGGPGARVRIRVELRGENATVAVADDGPGIAAGDRAHVFERFFRAPSVRSSVPGVGLGLAVVQAIARRHHGEIDVHASDLGGAELSIALPSIKA